jgi:glycosyltransferase involved in cell wall biosynthesis
MTFEVLLIGLGDEVLGAATEDAQQRHLRYADSIDHLHMIVWQSRDGSTAPVPLSPKLTVYPVGRGGRLDFVCDALRVGGELVRRHPIRVISTQDPYYTAAIGLWLRRHGVRLQIQNHSDFFDNKYWIRERPLWNTALNAFGKWAVHRADRLRVVNTTERQKYLTQGISAERVDVLPVPTDLAPFTQRITTSRLAELRNRWQIPATAPVLFWVGRPVAFKDLDTQLRAIAIVCRDKPEVCIVLGGDFSRAPQWQVRANEQGLANSVRFVGRIARDELPDYFALCSMYLHSSVYEGFGRVMVEAAAAGRAVVATRTAGALDIVRDDETGLLCPVRSPESFAAAVLKLLSDPDRAHAMGNAARSWVQQQFDPDRLTEGIVAAWRKCAE